MTPGGHQGRLTADRAGLALRRIHPTTRSRPNASNSPVTTSPICAASTGTWPSSATRMAAAVTAADTTITDIFGIGPIAACLILGHTGNIGRFATADRYASYNATAPVEASSGPTVRHRLNQRGNRQLNHAMHIAAIVQISHDSTRGGTYYQRKLAEGKRPKEAIRALKRRISDNVYRHLIADAARH